MREHSAAKPEAIIDAAQRIDHAERFFAATGADIRYGGNRAHSGGGTDYVQMPAFEAFRSPDATLDDAHGLRRLANDVFHSAKPMLSVDAETDVQTHEIKVADLLVIVLTLITGIR